MGFAGNLGDWYGRLCVDRLIKEWPQRRQRIPVEFRIYGKTAPESGNPDARCNGAYNGHHPFDELKYAMP